ncbi:leucine-rich repeat protein [Butyrivibrio sp. WCD3002]|uniref:leucine-rich repeat protein n=1 Tax=Butyrivibrio sp. WCD3002 TaxID=1280676 RepID=UPI0003FCD9A8|nr:leucine-rich repeat protein [Butyrivibrio sp. WCD3002]
MKKVWRRGLSIALAVLITATSVDLTAFASEEAPEIAVTDDSYYEEENSDSAAESDSVEQEGTEFIEDNGVENSDAANDEAVPATEDQSVPEEATTEPSQEEAANEPSQEETAEDNAAEQNEDSDDISIDADDLSDDQDDTTEDIVYEPQQRNEKTDDGWVYSELNGSFVTITKYEGTDTAIRIPETIGEYTVQEIADSAFYGSSFVSVTIPGTVIRIGNSAFMNSVSLQSVTWGDSDDIYTQKIEESAFSGCSSLENIILPSNLTTICKEAFKGCEGLSKVTLSDKVQTIEDKAFYDCTGLSNINFPKAFTSSGQSVFQGCTNLKSIEVPGGVDRIPNYAFSYSSIESIELPDNLEAIGEKAFYCDAALTEITLPEGLETIEREAFYETTALTKVSFPKTLKEIKEYVFYGDTSLKTLTFKEGLTTIEVYAFQGCSALTNVTLPDTIETLGTGVFSDCINLSSINYPKSLLYTYYDPVFTNTPKLTEITIPEGVEKITDHIFENSSISTVHFPSTLKEIGEYVFANDKALTTIEIPEGVTAIRYGAFDKCSELTKVTLPEGLKIMESSAFGNCTELTSIHLPDSLEEADSAFSGCTQISEINYPFSLKSGSVAGGMERVFKMTVPDGVEKLADEAFSHSAIISVDLPESLKEVGKNAFSGNNAIKQIILPDAVTTIREKAFSSCDGLKDIWIGENVTTFDETRWKDDVFFGCKKELLTIHGVAGSKAEEFATEHGYKFSTDRLEKVDGEIHGKVVDKVGNGISGVTIKIYDVTDMKQIISYITDTDGKWQYDAATIGHSYKVTALSAKYSLDPGSISCVAQKDTELQDIIATSVNNVETGAEYFEYEKLNSKNIRITGYTGNFETVVIPEKIDGYKVTEIYKNVFKQHSELKKVVLPDGLTIINDSAFYQCKNLKEVVFGSSLKSMGSYVFAYCESLEKINLPEGVTSISYSAFKDCKKLTTVELPDSLTYMGEYAFSYCPALEVINYPLSLESCQEEVFCGDTKLTSIIVPMGVKKLAKYVFAESYLTDITLPDSLEEIGEDSFSSVKALKEIKLPAGVRIIGSGAFKDATVLESVTLGENVIQIGGSAFNNCSALTDIKLNDGLEGIGAGAFIGCTSLASIELPDTVRSLGSAAFKNCTKLSSINYPLSLSGAGMNIFEGTTSLKEITVPEGVTKLPSDVFAYSDIEKVNLPQSLTEIEEYAFYNSLGIVSIDIPQGVKKIGRSAFQGCTGLTAVTFNGSLEEISIETFKGCTGLSEIRLPDGLKKIEWDAFFGCSSLLKAQLPDSVEYINSNAFASCPELREINYPMSLTDVGYKIYEGDRKLHVKIPEGVTKIVSCAFNVCSISSFELPSTLTFISYGAFSENTALRQIILPDAVTTIQEGAFSECSILQDIWIGENATTLEKDIFKSCDKDILTIHGIAGSKAEEYANQNGIKFSTEKFEVLNSSSLKGRVKTAAGDGVSDINVSVYNLTTQKLLEIVATDASGEWVCEGVVPGNSYKIRYHSNKYEFNPAIQTCIAEEDTELEDVIVKPLNYSESAGADFTYSSIGNLNIKITSYKGSGDIVVIPEEIDGYTVKEIGNGAFWGKAFIKKVIIPVTVTEIGYSAFINCAGLKSISLPEGLTKIGSKAFSGCTGLTEVVLPDTLTTIEGYAFDNCSELSTINYPIELDSCGEAIFWKDTKLTSMVIPEGTKKLADKVFSYSSIKRVSLPESLEVIGERAFYNDEVLEVVSVPSGVNNIGEEAFANCKAITQVKLPDSLTYIGKSAFEYCTALSSVNYPKSLDSTGGYVFNQDSALTKMVVPSGVTKIADGVFQGSCIKDFDLPDSVTEIGDRAFANNAAFESFEIPAGVTKLGDYAFNWCQGLTAITIPDGVKAIGEGTFAGTTKLSTVKIPDELEEIGEDAFSYCASLTDVALPNSVKTIGSGAFAECENLSNINYPMSLTWAGSGIFANDKKFSVITVPEGITNLAKNVFRGSCIKRVNLPSTLTEIGSCAFGDDIYLTRVNIPETVTSIGSYAFSGCEGLVEATISSTVNNVYEAAFSNCKNLKKVTVLNGGQINFYGEVFSGSPLTMYCYMGSPAMQYAIAHEIPIVPLTDDNQEDVVIDSSKSYYMTNSSDVTSSGYIDLVLSYSIKDEVFEGVSDGKLSVYFPSSIELRNNSVTSNNQIVKNVSFEDNHVLTIPVTEKSGSYHFTVVPGVAKALVSTASFECAYSGERHSEAIGVINAEFPSITLSVPPMTNSRTINVSGIAPASTKVTLYVDDEESATTYSSKGGKYKTKIELKKPADNQVFTVKAEAETKSGKISNTSTVKFSVSEPVVTGMEMYYRLNGYEQVINVFDGSILSTSLTFAPGCSYSYHVTMSNADLIDKLYVTSTRNGVASRIPAKYNEKLGCFITSEKFNNDNNYVPGILNVEFSLNDEFYGTDEEDLIAQGRDMVDDYIKNNPGIGKEAAEHTEVKAVDEDRYNAVVTLPSGSQVEVDCQAYSSYDEVLAELKREGYDVDYTPADDNESGPVSLNYTSELLDKIILSFLKNGFDQYADTKRRLLFKQDEDYVEIWEIMQDQDEAVKKWVVKNAKKDLTKSITQEIMNDHSDKLIIIDRDFKDEFGFFYSAGSSTVKYFEKVFELELEKYQATSDAERKRIEDLQSACTTALILRYCAAALDYAGDLAMTTNPLLCVGLKVAAFFIEDFCGELEEHGYDGIKTSYIGMVLYWLPALIFKWKIDPSGYVYEGVTDNRISGATATVYFKDTGTEGEPAVQWDASEYDQYNPQTTGGDGTFAWDVPEGLWKVIIEKAGYENAETAWLDVPPPQTGIGMKLKPVAGPEVESVDFSSTATTVSFTQYMKPAGFGDITLKDSDGNSVDYEVFYDQSKSDIDGTVYANKVQLVYPERVKGSQLTITVPESVVSGYDAAVTEFSTTGTVHADVAIDVTDKVDVVAGSSQEVAFKVTGYDESMSIKAAADYSSIAKVSDTISIDEEGNGKLTVDGLSDGITDISISVEGTMASKAFAVTVGTAQGTAPVLYSVSFYGGADTTGVAPYIERQEKGAVITLPENAFTREQSKFVGWSDGSKVYQPGDTYTVNEKVKFTAKWETIVVTVSVTGVALNKTETELSPGYSETLTATIAPANASNKNLKWESSNPGVAVVTNTGLVTAVGAGEALITVKTEDGGFSATCKVKVAAKEPAPANNGQGSQSQQPQQEIDDPTLASITANKNEIDASKLKKKDQTVNIKIGRSKGKITAKNASSRKLKKFLTVKVKGRKVICTLKKGAKKGIYKVKVTVGKKGKFKKTVKTIEITVK